MSKKKKRVPPVESPEEKEQEMSYEAAQRRIRELDKEISEATNWGAALSVRIEERRGLIRAFGIEMDQNDYKVIENG